MMKIFKELLLFASMMMFGLAMNGQDKQYIPLVNPNNTWSIVADGSAGGMPVTSFYLRTDDSTIMMNGREYHRIFLTYDTLGIEDGWNIVGYISEDSENEKCYFINLNSDEGLIYDFSAEIGDTLQLWNSYQGNIPVEAVIQEKDTVLIGNSYRKRLVTEIIPGGIAETWIEGIGSLNGLLFSNWEMTGSLYSLLCFFENNELVYHDEFYNTCYYGLNTRIEEGLSSMKPIINPNPAFTGNSVRISGLPDTADAPATIEVFDLTGRLLISAATKQTDFIFNAPEKPGVYFVIVSNSMFKQTLKMVVR